MLSSPPLPIMPAFFALVTVATAGAPFLTTTTSPTFRSSARVRFTVSSSTAVFEVIAAAKTNGTSVPSFKRSGVTAGAAASAGGREEAEGGGAGGGGGGAGG